MGSKPILYSYFRSSCSWRVRIALAIKGIEYEYRGVNLIKDGGEHLKKEFKLVNPISQVPALQIDGHTFTQSLPIIEYLEETNPETPLLPKLPADRARMRAFCEIINSGIQPIQNIGVLQYLGPDRNQGFAKHWISVGFMAVEQLLKESNGQYCFGDTVTLADVFLVPQVYNANRYQVDMTQFPIINNINDHLNTLDAFKVSHPGRQPDTPDDLLL